MNAQQPLTFRLLLTCLSACLIGGCAAVEDKAPAQSVVPPTYDEILVLTREHERAVDDGWFFGELPRIFKSEYGRVTPEIRARFAVDYAHLLETQGEDMVKRWDSYVPYDKRADFAAKWWSDPANSGVFAKQTHKMQVVWIHEALMDGSELWWRTFEKKNSGNTDSAQALAHDEEQKMVSDYANKAGEHRTLSTVL
jgi:hypothetical protein